MWNLQRPLMAAPATAALVVLPALAAAANVALPQEHGLGVSAVPAPITWAVSPGGSITANSGKVTLTDSNTGSSLTCTSSSTSGTLLSGGGLPGNGLGSITALAFQSCTGPLGITLTMDNSNFPWKLNAVSYDSSTGVTSGTITGIHSVLSGQSCSAVVDGSGPATDNGQVDVSYTNSSGRLAVLTTGGNLHLYNVSGCAGLINTGDPATLAAAAGVTPKQTIASTTWTVKDGGSFKATGKDPHFTLTDTKTKTAISCTTSVLEGKLKSGSGLSGTGIGSFTDITFHTCTAPPNIKFTLKATSEIDVPWILNAASFENGVTTGSITKIHLKLTTTNCSAVVDGTGPKNEDGTAGITYTNPPPAKGNGQLSLSGTGELKFYDVEKGCGNLFNPKGDAATLTGGYEVTPRQTITSP